MEKSFDSVNTEPNNIMRMSEKYHDHIRYEYQSVTIGYFDSNTNSND